RSMSSSSSSSSSSSFSPFDALALAAAAALIAVPAARRASSSAAAVALAHASDLRARLEIPFDRDLEALLWGIGGMMFCMARVRSLRRGREDPGWNMAAGSLVAGVVLGLLVEAEPAAAAS
ncbi:hypothetical protein JKP88DRAFT_291257, partial [Tribonema minus]